MKATGIVRKIDELGRVVIPKEIRKTHRIKVGDSLEIFTDRDGLIIFKKYSPIAELSNYASGYVSSLRQALSCEVYICDKDTIIADSGGKNSEYSGAYISKQLINKIEGRKLIIADGNNVVEVIEREDISTVKGQLISPVILEGDTIGAIILISREKVFNESDAKIVNAMVLLLENQMECY